LTGQDSVEQYERLRSGDIPFFRRWSTGEGLYAPYTLVTDKLGTYGINKDREFVRFQAQITRDQSSPVKLLLERIDDWTDAWAAAMRVHRDFVCPTLVRVFVAVGRKADTAGLNLAAAGVGTVDALFELFARLMAIARHAVPTEEA
jgi:hypothetical protein